jgi:hypothetical protein
VKYSVIYFGPSGVPRLAVFSDLPAPRHGPKPSHNHLRDRQMGRVREAFGSDDGRRDLASRKGLAGVP